MTKGRLLDRYENNPKPWEVVEDLATEMEPEHAQSDGVLENDELLQLDRHDLAGRHPDALETGRHSPPVEVGLPALGVKNMYRLTYRETQRNAGDSFDLGRFCRGHSDAVPEHTTFGRFVLDIKPETLGAFNERAETFGLIGRNGAGKSTLLKVLAGVTPPTRGEIDVRGRVFPMIELNAGLHRDLTGRENVHLLGAVMGLSRQETEAQMPEIEGFTELEEWFDQPVRKYSSGMLARLGFGVAMNVGSEILLVDEVLAVGDLGFQRKCYDRIHQIRGRETTIPLVSHSPHQIERLCDRVLLLDRGRAEELTSTTDTISTYYRLINEAQRENTSRDKIQRRDFERPGTGEMRVTDVRLLDGSGNEVRTIRTLDELRIDIQMRAFEPIVSPSLRIDFVSTANIVVSSIALQNQMTVGKCFDGECVVSCRIPRVLLTSDQYSLRIKVHRDVTLDLVNNAIEFKVVLDEPEALLSTNNMGVFYTEAEWDLSGVPCTMFGEEGIS